ncbi:hypothetical protein [Bacillus pakistanensis]|nr:hypothetical protein [Bacillus pakistanensis]
MDSRFTTLKHRGTVLDRVNALMQSRTVPQCFSAVKVYIQVG